MSSSSPAGPSADRIGVEEGLARLEAEIVRGFARLNHPPAPWTPELMGPDGRPAVDVLIVGGGMNGLAAALACRACAGRTAARRG